MIRAARRAAGGQSAEDEMDRRRMRFQDANPGVHIERRTCSYTHWIALWIDASGEPRHTMQPDLPKLLDDVEERFGMPGATEGER